jgi:hypothetical protein
MRFNYSQYYGQAHAPTGELGGVKRVKELLDILLCDSAAGIRHFQAGIISFPRLLESPKFSLGPLTNVQYADTYLNIYA